MPGGPWGASLGGGSGPMSAGRSHSDPLDSRIEIYLILISIWNRFGVDLGSLLGSFSLLLAPFSVQVGPGTVFEPSHLRKSNFSQNITFPNTFYVFCLHMAPQNDPRSLLDGPKIVLDRCFSSSIIASFFHRFGIGFGPNLGAQMEPGASAELGKSALGGSKTVLAST